MEKTEREKCQFITHIINRSMFDNPEAFLHFIRNFIAIQRRLTNQERI
jgi:hypothetical protein